MTKQINKLTDAIIKKLGAGRHADGLGLNIQVTAAGTTSWLLLYTSPVTKKRREMGLGAYPAELSIKAARELAKELREKVARGIDPIEDRKVEKIITTRSTKTFADVLELVIKVRRSEWKPRANGTYEQEEHWRNSLALHAPKLMAPTKLVASVTEQDVFEVLEPLWLTKHKVAKRLMERIRAVMEEAIDDGLFVGQNPARYKRHIERKIGKLIPPRKLTKRHPSMAYRDVPAFYADLLKIDRISASCLALIVLTGVRSIEARGARWGEIDLHDKLWTIPAERMKAGVQHEVPLSDEVVWLLKSLPRRNSTDLLFPGEVGGELMNDSVLYRLLCGGQGEGLVGSRNFSFKLKGTASVHGFRASFRTWAAKQKRWDLKPMEHALAHSFGSDVMNAYDRSETLEDRREMLQAWADFVTGKVGAIGGYDFDLKVAA